MRYLVFLFLFIAVGAKAENFSMRECMLLPITDSAGNALAFKVYEKLEEHLKDQKWCKYKSSADLLGIFSKYRERLKAHLQDPAVLKTVSSRVQAGTLIRIDLEFEVNSVNLVMDVIGENGEDLFFKEKETIKNADADSIVATIKNWLELYETNIPYDGQVIGVLGDQVTFSLPEHKRYGLGQEFKVKRFIKKTTHKLLKTVVEWDAMVIARGKIFNISKDQALGVIKVYTKDKKIKAGDWIKLDKFSSNQVVDSNKFPDANKYQFGKLGVVSINMNLSSSSIGTSPSTGSVKNSGFTYGVGVDTEAWITRNYFAFGEFSRSVGNLKKSSGSPTLETASITSGVLKIGAGYKYLPMGFFYGPQVNLYAGYARYSYNVEASDSDGFGENAISGFLLGVGGSIPVQKRFRIIGKGEIIPYSGFTDDSNTFSSVKSSGSMYFKLGASYQYNRTMTIDGGFEVINNSARFNSGVSQVNYRDSVFKIGSTFVY